MSTQARVLVTTANGRTGAAAVQVLLRKGHPVRALVSRQDARAQRLREAGVEVVVGSLYDWRDLGTALQDVQRVYHCSPFDSRSLHGAMLFALAAQQARVEVVALMSGWNPHPTHPSIMQREHWMANNLYRQQPFDVVHINPGMFAFPYFLGLPMVKHLGMLALPFGDGKNAPPASEDIGAVAAGALMNPGPFIGRCLRPTGPALLSPAQVAGVMGDVLGRRVRYRSVSTKMFIKAARAQGFPTFQIAQVRHYAAEMRAGVYADLTDHVAEVCGRPPETFEATTRRYLEQPDLIVPGLRAGSLLSTMWLATKMLFTRAIDLDAWESHRDYPRILSAALAHQSPAWVEAAGKRQLLLQPDLPRVPLASAG